MFIQDDVEAWQPARVVKQEPGGNATLELSDGRSVVMPSDEVAKMDQCGVSMNLDMENLVDLDAFSEGSILHHVRKRFMEDKIYTYTAKKVLQYLTEVAGGGVSGTKTIADQIMESNPVLEAFGNAKTLRNNNSSRFGKWMEVNFNQANKICGCRIVNYLLEKSRVVQQTPMERNYHVFYMMLAGIDPSLRSKLHLTSTDDYTYLNKSGCTMVPNLDDEEEFKIMNEAFKTLDFSTSETTDIYHVLAAILHIGNLNFESMGDDSDGSKISASSAASLKKVASTLQVRQEDIESALTSKTSTAGGRGSIVTVKLNPTSATAMRDALAKALYGKMFDWLVVRVNDILNKPSPGPTSHIGVLDIFGFEVFKHNSFEQLCINYANEKLQFHFNDFIFNEELKMYKSEGVPYENITFKDNGDHFAGGVEYDADGFMEKNNDTTSDTLLSMARTSGLGLVKKLFKRDDETAGSGAGPRGTPRGGRKSKKIQTIGSQFNNQLDSLMVSLRATMPHFIRCVKSNHDKAPLKFDGRLCLDQLKYAGLFEAIRIRKAGYSYRIPHMAFARRFAIIGNNLLSLHNNGKLQESQVCLRALENATECGYIERGNWEVGKTKVFLKEANDKTHLEDFRITRCQDMATRIASVFRMFRVRKEVFKDKFEKAQREAKIKAENAKNGNAATLLQTMFRGHCIRKRSTDLKLIVQLKIAMSDESEPGITDALSRFEGVRMSSLAESVVYAGKQLLRSIQERRKILHSLRLALDREDVPGMIELVERASILGLGELEDVRAARDRVKKIKEKRAVHRKLLDFLADDTRHSESIIQLLDDARYLGIDERFIAKVDVVYRDIAPRLDIRSKLRRGVETVDPSLIMEGMNAAEEMANKMEDSSRIQGFCGAEKVAAARVMKMLGFEEELMRQSGSASLRRLTTEWDSDSNVDHEVGRADCAEGARLSGTVTALCDAVSRAPTEQQRRDAVRNLEALVDDRRALDKVIRSYKWGRVYSAWKFPELNAGDTVPFDPELFFGLRPLDAYTRSLFTADSFLEEYGGAQGEEEKKEEAERSVDQR
ncbi:hypothetical protein TrRE_jg7792, partial [Triparma retinervis]